ncbi:MAG: D-alanine--D-alanine ligase [Cyanobacteria bacterium J06560_2]
MNSSTRSSSIPSSTVPSFIGLPLHVLHLIGSSTNLFYSDLSKLYAAECLQAMAETRRYTFLIACVTPDGIWRFPRSLEPSDITAAQPMTIAPAIQFLARQKIDVAIPQMFCFSGMTDYRALLRLLDIPYIGNAPFQMALTADKAKTKAIVAAAGVKVPKGELLSRGDSPSVLPPAIVKPNCADNSEGVSLVVNPTEYAEALATGFDYSEQVIVEDFIGLGREVRCGIVVKGSELVCLPLEEYFVDKETQPIRTHAHKLKHTATGSHSNSLSFAAKDPTKSWIVSIDDPVTAGVWAAAKKCHQALGCEHYSLFDFRIDEAGQPWFIEAGLYCSFSPKSVLVTMMAAAGVSLVDFFESALEQVTMTRQHQRTETSEKGVPYSSTVFSK